MEYIHGQRGSIDTLKNTTLGKNKSKKSRYCFYEMDYKIPSQSKEYTQIDCQFLNDKEPIEEHMVNAFREELEET